MICHIVFILIPQLWNSHQQPVFCNVWHISTFGVTLFDTEFMSLSYPSSCIKIFCFLYYTLKFVPIPFSRNVSIAARLFMKTNISYFNALFFFTWKYRLVYMTEVTLNSKIFIDICSIPLKFHMCMYDRMMHVYAQNQSNIHCSYVWKAVHNRTFWITLVHVNR